MIEFRKVIRDVVEYRYDPLTSEQTRINPARAKRAKQAESDVDLRDIIGKSRVNCAFCPERIEEKTPEFPKEICVEGRIRIGETVIFPNLNPFGKHHSVGTISKKHFLDLDEFAHGMLRDNLNATKNYIFSVHANDKEAVWPLWLWNYMPPSAGSIIHPHVQVLVETEPTPEQNKLLEESFRYYTEGRRNYWKDLVEEERKLDERYIASNSSLSVIAGFAPRGFNEIQFIFSGISSLAELSLEQIDDFADYLTKVLHGYKEIGIGSFNLATYSSSIEGKQDHFYWLNAKLISRPYPKGVYTSDNGPMERLHDIWVVDTLPEELSKKMKPFFR